MGTLNVCGGRKSNKDTVLRFRIQKLEVPTASPVNWYLPVCLLCYQHAFPKSWLDFAVDMGEMERQILMEKLCLTTWNVSPTSLPETDTYIVLYLLLKLPSLSPFKDEPVKSHT